MSNPNAEEEEAPTELSEDEENSKSEDEADDDDDIEAVESSSESESEPQPERKRKRKELKPKKLESDSDSDSESESESESDADSDSEADPGSESDIDKEEDTARQVALIVASKGNRKPMRVKDPGEKYDFPPDPENWKEEDLMEVWADAPLGLSKPGFDPYCVDKKEMEFIREELKEGRQPPIAPFYVPFRRYYPVVPTCFSDISTPKQVIEELDRIEEFLKWVSYIFEDGSSYEGTVWDDVAHGKGVFVGMNGLVRYEGEWFRNDMEGHGVVEVDVPHMEPIPGSKYEAQLRAEGQVISRDFMSPEDKKWLEKHIEDSLILANGKTETPFYDTKKWIKLFGSEPEKGRYKYAGQWKHGRFHGCGVYEVNERTIFGRFYFGQYLDEDTYGCDAEVSAMHAGIAEVAAAKARMFVNKPDGMVREYHGPYSDPQHPYMYEEDDVWMAPGFINQFYEVPDYWKMYVNEVDQEREMWLNSFYRAPLRLPMPAELEYWWWENDEKPEFVLINKEPVPDPENPSNLIYEDDPLILHTPTGRIINYVADEEHGIRLFWQPPPKEGEDLDPDNVEFLPLGFDEFYGTKTEMVDEDESLWMTLLRGFVIAIEPITNGLKKWAKHKQKESDAKLEQLQRELELMEIELDLKQTAETMDKDLRRMEKEEERKAAQGIVDEEEDVSMPVPAAEPEQTKPEPVKELERTPVAEEKVVEEQKQKEDEDKDKEDVDDDDDDGDDDEDAPSSFGFIEDQNTGNVDQKGGKFGKSTFAASSLSFAGSSVFSLVPPKLQSSFQRWKEGKFCKPASTPTPTNSDCPSPPETRSSSAVRFPNSISKNNNNKSLRLRYTRRAHHVDHVSKLSLRNHLPKRRGLVVETEQTLEHFSVLSWHTPLQP